MRRRSAPGGVWVWARRQACVLAAPALLIATLSVLARPAAVKATVSPPPPVIYAIDPNHGPIAGNTTVQIFGAGLDQVTQVLFGNVPGQLQGGAGGPGGPIGPPPSSNTITVQSPPMSATGDVHVTVVTFSNGTSATSAADFFHYAANAAPALEGLSVTSSSALGGTATQLVGTGFSTSSGQTSVTVTFPVGSTPPSTTMQCSSSFSGPPPHAGATPTSSPQQTLRSRLQAAGQATLATRAATSSTLRTAANLQRASGGKTTGTKSLNLTTSGTTRVGSRTSSSALPAGGGPGPGGPGGGPPGTCFVMDDQNISLSTPAGPLGTATVTVTANALTSGGLPITYHAPTGPVIYSIDPNHSPVSGSQFSSVTGTGFTGATKITFGTIDVLLGTGPGNITGPGTGFVGGDNNIVLDTPIINTVGTVDVSVTVPYTGGSFVSPPGPAAKFTTDPVGTPTIDKEVPADGSVVGGNQVTFYGSNLSAVTSVTFGNQPAQGFFPGGGFGSDNVLTVNAPPASGPGPVTVTITNSATPPNGNTATTTYTYRLASMPTITGIQPATGASAGGEVAYLMGSGFLGANPGPGGTGVFFGSGGAPVQTYVQNDHIIRIVTPPEAPGVTALNVTVKTPGGSATLPNGFTYDNQAPAPPTITAVSPGTAAAGSVVGITGTNLLAVNGVSFGTTAATMFNPISDNLVQVTVPAGSGTVDVKLTTSWSAIPVVKTGGFTYGTSPSGPLVYGVGPNHGANGGGEPVTLLGTGFTGATGVSFGGMPANNFFVQDDNHIQTSSPTLFGQSGAQAPVDVTVTVSGTTTETGQPQDQWTSTGEPPPQVDAADPPQATAPGGTQVTVYGIGLSNPTNVTLGTAQAGWFMNGEEQLAITTPPGTAGQSAHVQVTTTVNGSPVTSTTNPDDQVQFTTPATPTITAIVPSSGSALGGQGVQIIGSGFSSGQPANSGCPSCGGFGAQTTLTFGGVPVPSSNFFVSDDNDINLQSPSGTPGTVGVTVTTPSPGGTSSPVNYKFVAPGPLTLAALAPDHGSNVGGDTLWLTGSNLGGTTTVNFGTTQLAPFGPNGPGPGPGGQNGGFFVQDENLIQITTPATSASGPINVSVSRTFQGTPETSNTVPFTEDSQSGPVFAGISTITGAPGEDTFIAGDNFVFGGTDVKFGSADANSFLISQNLIHVTIPPQQNANPLDITVTTFNPATVGPGRTPQQIGTTTAHGAFTELAAQTPSVTSVEPNGGPGNTHLFITGTHLGGVGQIMFGPLPQGGFFPHSDTLIETNSPALPGASNPGTVDVTVSSPVFGGPTLTSAVNPGDEYSYPPGVNSISPTDGPAAGGTTVVINGTGLKQTTGVTFGTTAAASFTVKSDMEVDAVSPAEAAGTIHVTVTTPGGTSATSPADQFTFASGTVVTSVSPTDGPTAGGTSVKITGALFTGATAVKFGANPAASYHVDSDSQITAASPPGSAGTVDITVTSPSGTSSASASDQFTYVAQPTVTGVSPNAGPTTGGTNVTITGTDLSTTSGVTFGTVPATTFTPQSNTQVTVTSPPGTAGTVDIKVTTIGGTSATAPADQFRYALPPSVVGVSPDAGPTGGGTQVTITGYYFSGASQVNFGPNPGTNVRVASDTQLTVNSPAGTGTVDVTVTTPGGTSQPSTAYTFRYVPPPTIASVSPNQGMESGGTSVIILGANFTGATSVKFGNSDAASFMVNSDGNITAVSPAGSGTVDITVTTPSGTSVASSVDQFQYLPPPVLGSISPTSGPAVGGTVFVLMGGNFVPLSTVKFGSTPASSYHVDSSTQISGTTPPGSGTVDVTVTTPGGTSPTSSADKFTYIAPPAVTAVNPNQGPAAGGTSVTISGSSFGTATSVKFGATNAASFTVNSDSQITAVSPAGSPGTVDVAVTNPDGQSPITSSDVFTFLIPPPQLSGISPHSGMSSGGTAVVISGSGFAGATSVGFGPNAATFTVRSDSEIDANSPAGSGTVDVRVTTPGGTSATSSADQFTYQQPAPNPTTTFYFAEGFTGPGFSEKLYLLMPNNSGTALIDYYTGSGHLPTKQVPLTAGQVWVENVNADVPAFSQVSAKVTLPNAGVVERTINFSFGAWHGSTDKVGVPAPAQEWDFAEGSTLAPFSEFLTLQNPNPFAVTAVITYFTDAGTHPSKTLVLPPNSRTTVTVFTGSPTANVNACVPNGAGANCGVGPGIQGVSARVTADGPVIVERPFYVNGFSFGAGVIRDGHDAFGANAPAMQWNFAEGTTLPGFNEFLTIQNPNSVLAHVTVIYQTDSGAVIVRHLTVGPQSRFTIPVWMGADQFGAGFGIGGISAQVTSDVPIVAERPMYIVHNFGTGVVAGAHVVVGATHLAKQFSFAAATTTSRANDFLTIQNSSPTATAHLLITYYRNGASPVSRNVSVAPNSRHTVAIWLLPEGAGSGFATVGIVVTSDQPILVEKPTYDSDPAAYGATDTLGFTPASSES